MITRGDIFTNEEFGMRYKILRFLRDDLVEVEYSRNGHTEVFSVKGQQLFASLTNPELFQKNKHLNSR